MQVLESDKCGLDTLSFRVVIGSCGESYSDGRVVNSMASGNILVQGLKYNVNIYDFHIF